MQQAVMLSAIRGPDGMPKFHQCKDVIRWYRRCVLISAFDKIAIDNPYHKGGGSFTGPSCQVTPIVNTMDRVSDWEFEIRPKLDAFMNSRDELPYHYTVHFMHAVEILGYKHPDMRIRKWWKMVYERMVMALHLFPETEEQMDRRLGDNEEQWQERSDETAVCSD